MVCRWDSYYKDHPIKFLHMIGLKVGKFQKPILSCPQLFFCFTPKGSGFSAVPHCQFSRFPFTFIFCHVCRHFQHPAYLLLNFFVKLQCSLLQNIHLTNFLILTFNFLKKCFFLKILIASYGAIVRGSVFKMKFRVLSNEFESIETSPGFAQLLGGNWN